MQTQAIKRVHLISDLITGFLMVGTCVILYFGYLLLWPVMPLKVHSVKIDTPTVNYQTGILKYTIDYCKSVTAVSTVYRQLVADGPGAISYGFPSIEGVAVKGCRTQQILVRLPADVAPGRYYVSIDSDYPVNNLRSVHVIYRTPSFEVTK